jgi:hypothetical protein
MVKNEEWTKRSADKSRLRFYICELKNIIIDFDCYFDEKLDDLSIERELFVLYYKYKNNNK